jgi:small subunit ribosomal protein S11
MATQARGTRRTTTRKTVRRSLAHGQAHIHASFNNTIVTISDQDGNAVVASSAGAAGFKGSRKSTPFAARVAAEQVITAAVDLGLQEVDIFVKGPGPGREAAIRAIQGTSVRVRSISDVTPVPHNGCRPPKRRRV